MGAQDDLEVVRDLVRRLAGAKADAIISAAAEDWSDDPEEECEMLWDGLFRACPEAFGSPEISPNDSTAVGFAFRYAHQNKLPGAGRLVLTEEQQETVDYARALLRDWSGFENWQEFDHYVFDDECAELAAAWRLRNSGTGVAFTFHPGLERAALYFLPALAPYLADDVDPTGIAAIVLHEEAHLASAAAVGGRDPEDGEIDFVFELLGRLASEVAYIAYADEPAPDRETVVANAKEHKENELVALLARFPQDVELSEIVRSVAELAVAAARSQHELAEAEQRLLP